MVSDDPVYLNENRHLSKERYQHDYARSINDNDAFWRSEAERIEWMQKPSVIQNINLQKNNISIKWYEDGVLNASHNCIDRHLAMRANEPAIIWESDDGKENETLTYSQLHLRVCQFSGSLASLGVKKGDVVTLYMPMIPETAIAMLACARLGAIHSVVFAGFSPEALAERIASAKSKVIVTADAAPRGGRLTLLKSNVDAACRHSAEALNHDVKSVIVCKRSGTEIAWNSARDKWWHQLDSTSMPVVKPVPAQAEDPLFILYTSGSTGKPKGVVHSTGGYLVYATSTFHHVFDYECGDVFWCTADAGWITGHSYLIYAPLCHGGTTLLYEGIPGWPQTNRIASIIDKYQVNVFYTAPTVVRSLMSKGEASLLGTHRYSLRKLGSVGEPVDAETWFWFRNVFGNGRCAVVDTWWQTETGGIMISPLYEGEKLCPGAASSPFFGIAPRIVDDLGRPVPQGVEGNLVIEGSWPGQARTLLGDHKRFEQTYFSLVEGAYFTGDGAWQDPEGRFWITGRVDDVLNVSGHRLGTAEIESALCAHPAVEEAAVVGMPHKIKGESICACIKPFIDVKLSKALEVEIALWVRQKIGAIASVEHIHWVSYMPRTRSGKIVRRILSKIVTGNTADLGDLSTLAAPERIKELL